RREREGWGGGGWGHEGDPLQPARDHVVDGVAAGTAGPEHGDPWLELTDVGYLQIDAHVCLLVSGRLRRRVGPVRRRPMGRWIESSEALAKPSSDPRDIAASCRRLPRSPRFEMFKM